MKIAPKDIQVGDRVTVSGTVRVVYVDGSKFVHLDCGNPLLLDDNDLAHAEITRPEKPLEVGDMVSFLGGHRGRIAHIIEDRAWIKTVGIEVDHILYLYSLTRIEETRRD